MQTSSAKLSADTTRKVPSHRSIRLFWFLRQSIFDEHKLSRSQNEVDEHLNNKQRY